MQKRMAAILLTAMCFGQATDKTYAESFPSKPIRIVTTESGGGNDLVAWILVPELRKNLGQPVIIHNRAGANGIIAADTVVKSPPDGYTVLLNATSTWLLPLLADNIPYDPVKDLAPVMLVARQPNILIVGASVPALSVKDLIDRARAQPDSLDMAVGSAGGSTHLAAELFKYMSNTRIRSIPYKGTAPAINALLRGEVQIFFAGSSAAVAHMKSGKVKALGITTLQRSARFPDLPTIASAGLDGYESSVVYAIFSRSGTPVATINKLNHELARVLREQDVKQKFDAAGLDIVAGSSDELATTVKTDIARWTKVIKATGIRME